MVLQLSTKFWFIGNFHSNNAGKKKKIQENVLETPNRVML